MRGILGFSVEIKEIKAAFKLSHSRDEASYENIIKHLEKSKETIEQEMAKILRDKS